MNFENPDDNRVEFNKERLNRVVGITFAVLISIGVILSVLYEMDLIPKDVREPRKYIRKIFESFNEDYADSKKVYTPKEIIELEKKVKDIDKLTNVSARKYYKTYVELGNAYKSQQQYYAAHQTYMKALRLNSWDYAVHVKLAEVEIKIHKFYDAEKRLKNVIEFSKDRRTLKIAREFLDTLNTIEYSKQRIELPDMYSKRIYILQTDNVDYRFTEAVKTRIMEEFKISVVVLEDTIIPTTRNARIRQAVVYQYDADEIQKQLEKDYDYLIREPDNYGILLVTSYNIFAKNYGFLFGWSDCNTAVISYWGFVSPGVPFKKQIKRFVMQSFSSTGMLIGIPRCTNPTCARAYPHGLAEQDRKEDILCDECLENLIKVYKKK